ncbi:MAG TPA: PQQ-binding-like beta-propeller repeat protein, partial [Accumulibacter sp.]|nr:PQQ-binding-like beta-propeller repeat protein [Accumulibacter sp.]
MKRRVFALLLPVLLAGCSTLESLNPFSSSGPKMAELQPIQASAQARVVWQESVGKGGPYAFVPAVVGSSVYAAGRDGTIARFDDGRPVWRIKTEQPLSGGVGADERLLAVGTAKGDILAFAAADGKLLWEAKASSEVLAPPAVAGGLVIVRSGDHRLAAYDAAGGTRKWIYQRPNPALSVRVTAAPVVVEKYVFAGFPGGKLIAVNADNGAPLWEGTVALPKGATELDRIADVSSVPVIDARMICAVA